MIFESLWPLAFLLAVPVVVILYLLVPKGTDTPVSSNLLWKKLFYNEQSKTFWEKFLHNLLMYLQIVILLLLILALMAPFVQRKSTGSTDVVYLIDTSGSMKHLTKGGNTRLGEAVSEIKEQIAASDGAKISIVTCDGTGTNLLAVHTSEKKALYRTLADIKGTDTAGSLSDALATVQTVQKKDKKNDLADVIVYTDGIGAKQTKNLKSQLQATIRVGKRHRNSTDSQHQKGKPHQTHRKIKPPTVTHLPDITDPLQYHKKKHKDKDDIAHLLSHKLPLHRVAAAGIACRNPSIRLAAACKFYNIGFLSVARFYGKQSCLIGRCRNLLHVHTV